MASWGWNNNLGISSRSCITLPREARPSTRPRSRSFGPASLSRQPPSPICLGEARSCLRFYQGSWCPYCNIQLRAYQAALPQIAALGAQLVAISPQLPEHSLSTAQAGELTFDVLSDVGNVAARRFGLVYALPEELRAALRSNNKALPGINGDESWELPVPATYVIAQDGRIVLAYIEVDYRKRLGPEAILDALRSLQPS